MAATGLRLSRPRRGNFLLENGPAPAPPSTRKGQRRTKESQAQSYNLKFLTPLTKHKSRAGHCKYPGKRSARETGSGPAWLFRNGRARLSMNRSAGLRPGASRPRGVTTAPGRRPALQFRGSWSQCMRKSERRLSKNPKSRAGIHPSQYCYGRRVLPALRAHQRGRSASSGGGFAAGVGWKPALRWARSGSEPNPRSRNRGGISTNARARAELTATRYRPYPACTNL